MNVLLFKMLIRQIQVGNIKVEDIKDDEYKDAVDSMLNIED